MIPQTTSRNVEASGDTERSSFGISRGDEAHLMTVLRDTLYSDKVLAVLREYSSNAWDAHRDAGKPDVPIKVTLPTLSEPILIIEDYGLGLSRADIFGLFAQYGASTKRSNNGTVGMLGIGSKSAFAYSDSFTIISRHGGVRATYVAVLDASNRGEVRLLDECATDETGLTIQVAVRPSDVPEFRHKAQSLFAYMQPRPVINIKLGEVPSSDSLTTHSSWTAVMGCVPYRVDLNQLTVPTFVYKLGGVLYFNIGELQVAASREALKYSEQTKQALETKINSFLDAYVQQKLEELDSGSLTSWQKRLAAQPLKVFDLALLKPYANLLSHAVEFEHPALLVSLAIKRKSDYAKRLPVDQRVRLVLRDDKRGLKGFAFGHLDYIVRLARGYEKADLQRCLAEMLARHSCEGITVVRTSELPWTKPEREWRSSSGSNPKHKAKCFVLKRSDRYYLPFSDYWEPIKREPQPTDLCAKLTSFECGYYNAFNKDAKLLEYLGLPVPEVYGFKEELKGIEYGVWRKKLGDKLYRGHKKAREAVEAYQLTKLVERTPGPNQLAILTAKLGEAHPIVKLLTKASRALATKEIGQHLLGLLSKVPANKAQRSVEVIFGAYPLLKTQDEGLAVLWSNSHADLWIDYVKRRVRK